MSHYLLLTCVHSTLAIKKLGCVCTVQTIMMVQRVLKNCGHPAETSLERERGTKREGEREKQRSAKNAECSRNREKTGKKVTIVFNLAKKSRVCRKLPQTAHRRHVSVLTIYKYKLCYQIERKNSIRENHPEYFILQNSYLFKPLSLLKFIHKKFGIDI